MRIPVALTTIALVGAVTVLPGARAAEPARENGVVPSARSEQATLQAIQGDALAQVDALARRIGALPDGPDRRELEQQVFQIKTAARVRTLQTMIEFARSRGDVRRAEEAQRQLAMITAAQSIPADVASAPQTPDKQETKEVRP